MNNKTKSIKLLLCILGALILAFVDRLTKVWAVNNLMNKEPIWIIKNVLQLYYLPNGNKGAAWGMLEGHQYFFIAIAILVIMVIAYVIYNMPVNKKYNFMQIMLVFIAAGGIGNMYDRAFQGYVVDFIYFSIINFPIFNVADMYVSVCTILFALYLIFKIKDDDLNEIESALKEPFRKLKK